MKAMISVESYELVQKLANKFSYGNTRSLVFDLYVSAGLEGLKKAVETYQEGSNILFSTYAYRCIMNALINEQKKMALHDLQEDENVVLENYDGEMDEIKDENMVDIVRRLIRKVVNNNERNAKIVELNIGLDCEPMELKDIAKMFNLSHESVRLVTIKARKAMCEDTKAKELLFSFVG